MASFEGSYLKETFYAGAAPTSSSHQEFFALHDFSVKIFGQGGIHALQGLVLAIGGLEVAGGYEEDAEAEEGLLVLPVEAQGDLVELEAGVLAAHRESGQ